MDTLTLTHAGASGGQFAQQGAVDWIQLARMTVSIPVSILTRVTAADVSPLTIVVGQEMSSLFQLSTTGYARLTEALGELKSFSAIGDVIWFGFGIKHILRVLAETTKGLTCLTLCGCLSEIHPPKTCAEILIRLADACGAPDELRPSPQQWINLVEACSGILKSTTFGCIAEQFMTFYGHHAVHGYVDDAKDVAKALLAIARVSSGVLESATLTGGRSCGWIAAIGYYFLGLDVEIRSTDDTILYKSTTKDDSIRIFVIYGATRSSNQVQVSSTAYFVETIEDIMSSWEDRFESLMSGSVPWENCIFRTFGASAVQLFDAGVEFGALIGSAARVFQGLTKSDPSSIFTIDDRQVWFGFQPGQYGHGFVDSAISLFPELAQLRNYIHVNRRISLDDSVEAYAKASEDIAAICRCRHCSRGPIDKSTGPYCLAVLAETIISLVWNLSALQLHADLKPYHSGLRFMYELHSGDAETDSSFGERYGGSKCREAYWGDIVHLVRLLDLASVYHTAQFLFTTSLHPQRTCSAFTAASVGGICFYFDLLQNVSDRPERAMILHVVPGAIQTRAGRRYSFVTDKAGMRSTGLLGFDWRDNNSFEDTPEFRLTYPSKPAEMFAGSSLDPMLALDTGSPDLEANLIIEESAGGLLADLYFVGLAGSCRVGAYAMLREVIEHSGLVQCAHRDYITIDRSSSNISVLDGEGLVPQKIQPMVYLRRLHGNAFARCVGLLAKREWTDPVILRGWECIPCCIKTAVELHENNFSSSAYVIL
ncbi:hypothetical protein FALCPG4_015053 [Fusarium falciforme]